MLTVGEGATRVRFDVNTVPVKAPVRVLISVAFGGKRVTRAALKVLPSGRLAQLSLLELSAATVSAGGTVTGTVTLARPAPARGAGVTLASDDSAVASCPASVFVPAGATRATFSIATAGTGASRAVTISAICRGVTRAAGLTVLPAASPPSERAPIPAPSPAAGSVRRIEEGDDLQQALDAARPGDTLVLAAGATFSGNFILPKKEGAGWITIQSSALEKLPPAGERVTPEHARFMPRLLGPQDGSTTLRTAPGAHHWRLLGIEITTASTEAFDLVKLGDVGETQDTPEEVPHHLLLDRCWLHGLPHGQLKRGLALQSAHTALIGCSITEVKRRGQETQALCGWNGPGPFLIENNYLEGAGINVLFGGADPSIANLVPSDITFRRNLVAKPWAWRGSEWTVKNLLELKNARRMVIDGNVFENNWVESQNGYAIVITVRNADGKAPWSSVEEIAFTNNIVRHSANGLNLYGRDVDYPSQQSRKIRIANNLLYDIDGGKYGGRGDFLQMGATNEVIVEHNTVLQTGPIIVAHTGASEGFVFRNNVMAHNEYGVLGDATGIGNIALKKYFPGAIFARDVIPGANAVNYPEGNFYPSTLQSVGFIDPAGGNFRLGPQSPYRGQATNGRDIGCDIDALEAAMR
jgi:hypothetical protein